MEEAPLVTFIYLVIWNSRCNVAWFPCVRILVPGKDDDYQGFTGMSGQNLLPSLLLKKKKKNLIALVFGDPVLLTIWNA